MVQDLGDSTDDIACWFVDTDYNGERFFARDAYPTGAEEPYDKLRRTLRAGIDEGAWLCLYRTVSRGSAQPLSTVDICPPVVDTLSPWTT
jgi:adenine-specific DNA-methyltransferase